MNPLSYVTVALAFVASVVGAGAANAQSPQAQEMTFFSNNGMSGGQFTVSGTRTKLDLPFSPRSLALQGGGQWQVCSEEDYRGRCETIVSSQRDFTFGQVRSVRAYPALVATTPWREIARLDVRDGKDRDQQYVTDRSTVFRGVKVCSQQETIRIRRAEVQLASGQWQRLFVPLALSEGDCSDEIDLLGKESRIRAVRFQYEAWSPGFQRGTMTVRALPAVAVQPR